MNNDTQLQNYEIQLNKDLCIFKEEICRLDMLRMLHRKNYENEKQKMNENDKYMKEMITAQTNKLLAE